MAQFVLEKNYQPNEIRGDKLAEVLRLLKLYHVSEVHRRTGISKATVAKIARKHGIVTIRGKDGCPPGMSRKRRAKPILQPVTEGPNYRAQAAHQRWGSRWFS